MAASMPPHGPAPGRGTPLPTLLSLIGKPFICSHRQDGRSEGPPAQHALRISFSNRQQPVVLARVPVWDLERHGCRARAYTDVLAACPTPARVQAPAANRSIRVELRMSCTRLVGRQRGAASGVGTRRKSIPGGSVAASMSPHGPAPGRGTTRPALPLLIGKQCFKHVLMPADFPGRCNRQAIYLLTSPGWTLRRISSPACPPHFFQQPITTGGACAGTGVGP
ncbi:hypothetical protein XAC301_09150 [Xanthomonas arboricola pv. corylina]|uniref:Uncharacterized protein n=1 Tax=Xanthomonas arboricola pv. corylina TaxID=487821 RepID=A0ABM8QXC2_9XANT|nr:hypothetical protein XAC301_09150 [Xanthomonas arboricola pv. corylina]CAE6720744.1 hypothetical protein XAC301_09150 [Xanthomonas arboricola pv. corylina]